MPLRFRSADGPQPNTVIFESLRCVPLSSYLYISNATAVEADYTVIFFAAGGKYTPGWNWVWKAYRSLSRKYRKNLKRLFIVHSSFFSKSVYLGFTTFAIRAYNPL